MAARAEDVDGAFWSYTHQCLQCGMGCHFTEWESTPIGSLSDLYTHLHVNDWEDFYWWAVDFTDGGAFVMLSGEGITCCAAQSPIASVFEIPGDLMELMADLQVCEHATRADWKGFSGEAARRLKPLDWDPERAQMPDSWFCNDDGEWVPRTVE